MWELEFQKAGPGGGIIPPPVSGAARPTFKGVRGRIRKEKGDEVKLPSRSVYSPLLWVIFKWNKNTP